MSLEFSQEMAEPIVCPTFAPQDAGEVAVGGQLHLQLVPGRDGLGQGGGGEVEDDALHGTQYPTPPAGP